MRIRKLGWIIAAGGFTLACISSAYGTSVPINYQSQVRGVSANSMASGFTRGGTNNAPTTDTQNQSQQANGFGDFGGNAAVTSTLGPDGTLASAMSSQQSSLNTNEISASGTVRADSNLGTGAGPATSSATTTFHITFDISAAQAYAFSANLNGSIDPAIPGNSSASIALTDFPGNNIFAPIATTNLINFQTSGTLAAGVYSLAFDAQAISNDQSANFVNYAFSLTTGDGATLLDAPIPENPAVPLPPAAPVTLLMLASMAAISLIRRRQRLNQRVAAD